MATTKNSVKKSVSKPAAAKKPVAHKAPAKKSTTVRTKKAAKQESWDLPSGGKFKTFQAGKVRNFFSVRITDQTVYWAILCFIVLALGIWVVTIDDKVQRLYDQIDADNADDSSVVVPAKKVN